MTISQTQKLYSRITTHPAHNLSTDHFANLHHQEETMNTNRKSQLIADLIRVAQLSLQIKCDSSHIQDCDDKHARFSAFNQYNRKFLKDVIAECDNLCQSPDNVPYVPKYLKPRTLDHLRFVRQFVNPDRAWYENEVDMIGCQTDGQATDEMSELMQETMEHFNQETMERRMQERIEQLKKRKTRIGRLAYTRHETQNKLEELCIQLHRTVAENQLDDNIRRIYTSDNIRYIYTTDTIRRSTITPNPAHNINTKDAENVHLQEEITNTSHKAQIIADLIRVAQLSLQIKCDTSDIQDCDDKHALFSSFHQYNRKILKAILGECDNLCQSPDNVPYVPKFLKPFTLDYLRFVRQLVNPDRVWYENEVDRIGCQTDGQATDEMLERMQDTMDRLFMDVKHTLPEQENQRSFNLMSAYEDVS